MPKIGSVGKPKTFKRSVASYDSETTGINLQHKPTGPFFVTACEENGTNTFWEWKLNPLTRVIKYSKSDCLEIIEFLNTTEILVGHNMRFDFKSTRVAMKAVGLEQKFLAAWNWSRCRDTLLAAHLLASNQAHDLTTCALIYLDMNISPAEEILYAAVNEARRMCRLKINVETFGNWMIAKAGLPCMPSAKGKLAAFDYWLPKAIALQENYSKPKTSCKHNWKDWECSKCKGHRWHIVLEEYSNLDSVTTLPLWLVLERLLKEKGLWKIYEERLKLLPVISSMEEHGVTMSRSRKDELCTRLLKESDSYKGKCIALADGEIEELPKNGASNALKHVLFNKFKLQANKATPKGEASTDKSVLDHWLATLPKNGKPFKFIESLRGYRRRQTALGYLESYVNYWQLITGDVYKVYPSLNPTGTDTLRFSSQNPNAQQVSKSEEVNTRYCFGPGPGREWYTIDYENIELMIPGYESGERCMIDLFEKPNDPPYFGSYHLLNASIVYPDLFWPLADEKGAFKKKYGATWYQWIKNMGFAFSYGAQEFTTDAAAHKKGAYKLLKGRLKEHSRLNQHYIDFADKHGYVETLPDKTVDPKRGYPIYCSRTTWGGISPTVPLNYHVQSTAMWCTSKAMIRCHAKMQEWVKEGFDARLILQVHDELIVDLPIHSGNPQRVKVLQSLMAMSGNDIGIPLRAAATHCPVSWAGEN